MPRPTMDVNGPEYQAILRERDMARRYGIDYKDMMWTEDTLIRLEKKLPYGDYTDKDRSDFLKIKNIHTRVFRKTAPNESMPWNSSKRQDGHITSQYIWHTQGDDKVRVSHVVNNGKIFSWSHAPSTGHPGEDFNCRCWTEPVPDRLEEQKSQVVTSPINDSPHAWGLFEFGFQYQFGNGGTFTLEQIGLLQRVIDHAQTYNQVDAGGGTTFERIERQVFRKAREKGQGNFTDDFRNGKHHFGDVAYALGHVPIWGNMDVHVIEKSSYLIIAANINYNFLDRVADLANTYDENIPDSGLDIAGSTPFYVTGKWRTRLEAIIKKDSSQSQSPNH